jgi:hypothetical protein
VTSATPAICVQCDPEVNPEIVFWVLAGIEEEGVPVLAEQIRGEAMSLARAAAEASHLFIGIGLDASGNIALCDQRLSGRHPLLLVSHATPSQAKAIGSAAGRMVKGRPIGQLPNDGTDSGILYAV